MFRGYSGLKEWEDLDVGERIKNFRDGKHLLKYERLVS
jgi:hypothetical protein